jgi:branched-subunit amino acid transport protein AzlD
MYPPVAAESYPPSYEKVVPKSVLKALFYCSAKERKHCEVQYGIPAVVSVVISIIR